MVRTLRRRSPRIRIRYRARLIWRSIVICWEHSLPLFAWLEFALLIGHSARTGIMLVHRFNLQEALCHLNFPLLNSLCEIGSG